MSFDHNCTEIQFLGSVRWLPKIGVAVLTVLFKDGMINIFLGMNWVFLNNFF